MDLSKIPGNSSAREPTPQPAPPAPAVLPVASDRVADPIPAGDSYFAIAIGLLTLLLFPRLFEYLSHKVFGTNFAPFVMPDGTVVSYFSQPAFVSDLAIASFGVALILEGALRLLLGHRRPVYLASAAIIGAATLLNAFVFVTQFQYGIPIFSALACIFGGYAAFTLFTRARV